MRDFILSDITGGVKAPFTKRSLEHVNEMTSESNAFTMELASNYSAFSTSVVIIKGCDITGSFPGIISYTAGIIYYAGDFYRVDANASLTISALHVPVWQIIDTTISGDPATFSDLNTYDFHRIRKMRLVSATAGTGLADYNQVKLYNKVSSTAFALGSMPIPITAFTIDSQAFIRNGNRVDFWVTLTVTTTSSDTFQMALTIVDTVDYTVNNNVFYNNSYNIIGTVVNTSVSSNFASGVVKGLNSGYLEIFCTRITAATSHTIGIKGSYFTEVPYSNY